MITRRGINYDDDKVLGEAEATSMHAAPVLKVQRCSQDGRRGGGGNSQCFNYSIHGKGTSAAGLICHSNNVQLKRENASIILLLECRGCDCAERHAHSRGKVRVHQA